MSSAKDVDVMALEIGSKIKELRQKKGFTLQDVSSLAGLSKPLISQIENNRVVPPVATLLKLARALEVTIGYFFQEDESSDRVAVTRKEERRTVARLHHQKSGVGYFYESLEVKKSDKHMDPFLVTFDVEDVGDIHFFSHEGEEFVHVLSGELEFRIRDQAHVLHPGDSLYFESDLSHAFRSLGSEPAQALIVIYHRD